MVKKIKTITRRFSPAGRQDDTLRRAGEIKPMPPADLRRACPKTAETDVLSEAGSAVSGAPPVAMRPMISYREPSGRKNAATSPGSRPVTW